MSRAALLTLGLLLAAPAAAQDDEDLDDVEMGDLGGKKEDPKKKGKAGAPAPSSPGGDDEDPDWDAPEPEEDDPIDDLDGPPAGGSKSPARGGGDDPDDDAFFSDDPPEVRAAPKPAPKPAAAPPPAAAAKPAGPAPLRLDLTGKAPLADNWPAAVVATDLDAVVVELPVLVARKPADHTADYWVVTEVKVGGKKVTETRAFVSKPGIADLGPTVVWVKAHVPVYENRGTVQLAVSSSTDGAALKPLFTRELAYSTGG